MGDGKKVKVDEKSIVALKGDKGGDFSDFSFKEGNTATIKLQDVFIQEKGKDALKRLSDTDHHAAAPRVKGGAKGKAKAASKSKRLTTKKEPTGEVAKRVEKILKYTPSKSAERRTPSKGKVSAKRSVGKKHTPAMPSPGGKKSTKTTD
jgi:hypothetical protein